MAFSFAARSFSPNRDGLDSPNPETKKETRRTRQRRSFVLRCHLPELGEVNLSFLLHGLIVEQKNIYRPLVPSSFLLLVVGPGAPSSVLAPSSDALCY